MIKNDVIDLLELKLLKLNYQIRIIWNDVVIDLFKWHVNPSRDILCPEVWELRIFSF